MIKYKTTTCGYSGNYTVTLYRDYNTYWKFIKATDYTTKTLRQAFKKFIKENKLKQ